MILQTRESTLESNSLGINLLPKEKGKFYRGKNIKNIITAVIVAVAFLAVLSSTVLYMAGRIYQARLLSVSKSLEEEESVLKQFKQHEVNLHIKNDKLSAIAKILDRPKSVTSQLDKIINLVPKGVEVESLTVSENDLTLSIKTTSLATLETFLDSITDKEKGAAFLKAAVLSGITSDKEGGTYTVNIKAVL